MKKKLIVRINAWLLLFATIFGILPLATVGAFAATDGSVQYTEVENDASPSPDVFDELEGVITDVSSADELEAALAAGDSVICIRESFVLDRTFFITSDAAIYSEHAVTLTRAADFGSELFVVGEFADGTLCESEVTLTLGDPASTANDLLTVDGNKANMTVDVVGSAIFVTASGIVDIFANVTMTNHKKVGNSKTSGDYTLSYPDRVGGAVAIVTGSAEMNIYGGIFTNNGVNETADDNLTCLQGGVIYNYGVLSVYGGTFDSNRAYYGGVFFNYRKMYIYRGVFSNNHATSVGGAIYMPNSTSAYTYIGEENDIVESAVTFSKNSSVGQGGAIYARNYLTVKNALFFGNSTDSIGGAISAYNMRMTVEDSCFEGNISEEDGAAIYLEGNNGIEDVPELTVTETTFEENVSANRGGAIYTDGSRVYITDSDFLSNSATYGGGFAALGGALVEINGANFQQNGSTKSGGAVYSVSDSTVIMNDVYAYQNSAVNGGGFLYAKESTLTVFNSIFEKNTATSTGGAMNLQTGVTSSFYGTEFKYNESASNGGALNIQTGDTTNTLFNSCTFTGNKSANYGGALHISTKTQAEMYATVAKDNEALYGGFMYETVLGTVVTVGGLTVSGNTAPNGPIIWGNTFNAKLYLDKTKYLDLDVSDDWDEAYWAAAIMNKLTVYEQLVTVPSYVDYNESTVYPVVPTVPSEVTTAAELERALAAGLPRITIKSSFTLDRTFYITSDVVICSTDAVTLTRSANFGGDLFVVGEFADGTLCENEVILTFGVSASDADHLLTLDGNKANMTVDVVGSLFFVTKQGILNIYDGVKIQNHKKVGNSKTSGKYTLSYPERVGGAVAIVTGSAEMNIYGGIFTDNGVNETADDNLTCLQGGVIYNYGVLSVYGGRFENNRAYYGGVFFNYRTMYIYNAEICDNYAKKTGGAIYMPNSTSAYTYIGEQNDTVESKVIFERNASGDSAGAIYAKNYISIKNTVFKDNTAVTSGAAIYATALRMYIENTSFIGNEAGKYGGAISIGEANGKDETDLSVLNCRFESNTAASYGGAIYLYTGAVANLFNTDFISNSANYGGAFYLNSAASLELNRSDIKNNSSVKGGGAIYMVEDSTLLMNAVYGYQNSGAGGGFLYAKKSTLSMYNSVLEENTSSSLGGAINLQADAASSFYATEFKNNVATGNGGALNIYTGNAVQTLFHSCTFTGNTSGNYGGAMYISSVSQVTMYAAVAKNNEALYGGFMYVTVLGTVVTVGGLTVSGNTAPNGPIIYGNSFNATMYLDKEKYVDLDHTGSCDDAYFASAIANKLTVSEAAVSIPKYLDYGNEPYDHMADAVDVKSSAELEAAILSGAKHIRIVADFELDRTFFITDDVTIFSTIERTLTRAKNFGGDIFVIGEDKDGNSALLLGTDAKLTLGNPLSVKSDLLTIDGNRDNMEVAVNGSVLFIAYSSHVALYENVTIKNCQKVGNERVLDEKYILSSPNRAGGAVALVLSGTLDIYGGKYLNNRVNDIDSNAGEDGQNSTNGGAIDNRSNVTVYGGWFEGNHGARGGVIYNYTQTTVYSGTFRGNSSSNSGGVFYCPSVSACHLWIGTAVEGLEKVVLEQNSSSSNGGTVYGGANASVIVYGNTEFIANTANGSGGAIVTYGQLTVRNALLKGNTAKNRGGAIYAANGLAEETTRIVELSNCIFEENTALLGGAIQTYASESSYPSGAILTVDGCTFTANMACPPKGSSSAAAGGAIHADRKSNITINASSFTNNSTTGEGGALYAFGMSVVNLNDSTITGSVAGSHGGAITARSVYFNINGSTIRGNASGANGGAIYVSYSSSFDINTTLTVRNTEFRENTAVGNGGAIYATKRTITEEHRILDFADVIFSKNVATASGGALSLVSGSESYMKNITFEENESGGSGGALLVSGAVLELDTATVTSNKAVGKGGAFYTTNDATVIFNKITASKNTSESLGGFLYSEETTMHLYNSTLSENTAASSGGAIALYDDAVSGIYNTVFDGNISELNGGAITVYTDHADGVKTVMHDCTFKNNQGENGGAIYISAKSILELYNSVATANTALKGGFLYVTTTGTVVTLNGVTVSENVGTDGGDIIWGNSTGAKLLINKRNYTDTAVAVPDAAYWSEAIANKLTVEEIATAIPKYTDYDAKEEPKEEQAPAKKPVPVSPVFELAKKSSDASINSTYNKFPRLDNSSNFMSKGQTTFENINGETVTVDTFVYPADGVADNVNVGQGLMIYQAMLYKQANPDEEVYIDISSYRFSVQAAVNINRDSRYFGYMRQLSGVEYDQYGFVRIAYLLVCAAKMGIHVNIVAHTDAYPLSASELKLYDYFTTKLNDPCDPAYITEKTVGEYLSFNQVGWTLSKGGTDMMHTKLCAVSHYLDMNGVAHKNAVWTSSANLDGINSKGKNANTRLQTGTIVTNHEAIYRTSVNYLRLMAQYKEQEEIYELQNIMKQKNREQAALILAGRGAEIPPDEQLIYLGTENDDVFELYFTPFGGDALVWDEVNNPYCKYIRKMYDSEDYIVFTWNAAEYNGDFAFAQQLEAMIIAAFHENRNVNNKIYGIMDSFDASSFDDLTVGVDIGFKSFNTRYFGQVHNKDILLSYVENGQRYYVSLLNSLNLHSGSMYYQSNFALVIKEKTCADDSVFSTITKHSVYGEMVTHSYDAEEHRKEVTETEHGYTYLLCSVCGDEHPTDILHRESDWITLREPKPGVNGLRYRECTICGEHLTSEETILEQFNGYTGAQFTQKELHVLESALSATPQTIEAVLTVPKSLQETGGVIFGNYGKNGDTISLEVTSGGRIALRVVNNGVSSFGAFGTDIRSDEPVHITVLVRSTNVARLFVNGVYTAAFQLNSALPNITDGFAIGGDYRSGNTEYFKGTLYSLALFDDVRSMAEIAKDAVYVPTNAEGLLFSKSFSTEAVDTYVTGDSLDSISFTANEVVEIAPAITEMPHTYEALIQVAGDTTRKGAVISNYGRDANNAVSIEIYTDGRVRFFTITNGVRSDCIFDASVLSSKPVHIAVTVEGQIASLYINGEFSQSLEMTAPLTESVENFAIGGDYRNGNAQYFKGAIYSVNLFADVRSAEEIKSDAIAVSADADSLLYSAYAYGSNSLSPLYGQTFTPDVIGKTACTVSGTPLTFESVIMLPTDHKGRGGVIIGNHGAAEEQINLEVYNDGKFRLYYVKNGIKTNCYFATDVRSDTPVHVALTVDGKLATLYINGEQVEQKTLPYTLPSIEGGFTVGGDSRAGNTQYFKGTLYSVSLYDTVKTAQQIKEDAIFTSAENAMFKTNFVREEANLINENELHGKEELFIERELSSEHCGLLGYRCADCGEILRFAEFTGDTSAKTLYDHNADTLPVQKVMEHFASTPKTYEFTLQLAPTYAPRAGTLFGNYDGSAADQFNIEVYENGMLRLYYKVNGIAYKTLFTMDIRSEKPQHVTLLLDGIKAHLYLNGVFAETVTLETEISDSCDSFCIGADNRVNDPQYFAGELYSVHIFEDIRSEQEIAADAFGVPSTEDGLLLAKRRVNAEN